MKKTIIVIDKNVKLTPAQAKAHYTWTETLSNGKPFFCVPTRKVISEGSQFQHKKLCDGRTFTLGWTCGFSCQFCYVKTILCRHAGIARILKESGLAFQDVVVEKEDPLPVLTRQLVGKNGQRKFPDPKDRQVVFSSPMIDVAANRKTALLTVEACRIILDQTAWTIRLLSKSAGLKLIAEGLSEYRERVIYGLSTGTLADNLARAFELGASSPSARVRTLRWLQDNGYRTFGMICPSLPQEDYASFSSELAEAIRADRCEHVWAEVLNVRGKSMERTCTSLRARGFEKEAVRVEQLQDDPAVWETNARQTFLAHARTIPPEKLRFLQYVGAGQREWWAAQKPNGAILLGKTAATVRRAGRPRV